MDIVTKTVQRRLPKGSHKGRQSAHNVGKYQRQRLRTNRNKFAAQQKHLAIHPNDVQAVKDIHAAWDRQALS